MMPSCAAAVLRCTAVEAECAKPLSCIPCRVFCKSPCSHAYFRATECFSHYHKERLMPDGEANAGCMPHLLRCLWQHDQLVDTLDARFAAAKEEAKAEGATPEA